MHAGEFWVSDEISVADIAIFAQLHALRTDLTPWQRTEIAARPRLSAYIDRVDRATSMHAGARARARAARTPLPASLAIPSALIESVRFGLAAD